MKNEFEELSYLVRHAPIDIVLGDKKMVWMNDRWYLYNGEHFNGSVAEDYISIAFEWLVNDWWIETQGHDYIVDMEY